MRLPPDIVAGLSRRLAERAGLELPAWVVASRAGARMQALGLAPAAYLELISAGRGAAELAELVEAVRVGETRFFRHRSQVDALIDVVAPAIAARGRRPVRVWSAGCATGEEAYTLALVLTRALPEQPVTVVATDVSEDALEIAARARYPRSALRHVPDPWRDGFEDAPADAEAGAGAGGPGGGGPTADEVRVRPDIARHVVFERANLVDGEAPRGCAVVWCRNVLIYFAPEARRRAVQRLVGALEPGGWLFVGYSEHLRDVAELEPVRAGDATIYVRRHPTSPGMPVPVAGASGSFPGAAASGSLPGMSSSGSFPGAAASGAPPGTSSSGSLPASASASFPGAAAPRRTPAVGIPITGADRPRTPAVGIPITRADRPRTPAAGVPITPLEKTPRPTFAAPPAVEVTARAIVAEGDCAGLGAAIATALAGHGLRRLEVDLDGATFVPDEVAITLRRARAAAAAAGVTLILRATRPGTRRWLRRHALESP